MHVLISMSKRYNGYTICHPLVGDKTRPGATTCHNSPRGKSYRVTQKKMVACFFGKSGHAIPSPFLLRTDGQSLRAGTCTTVSRMSSKFGAIVTQTRTPWPFLRTQEHLRIQQKLSTFSRRARCSCCHRGCHRIRLELCHRDIFLLEIFRKWRSNRKRPYLRASKMHVELSRGLLKTQINGLRCGTGGFTAWNCA